MPVTVEEVSRMNTDQQILAILGEILESVQALSTQVEEVTARVEETLDLAEKLESDIEALAFDVRYPGLEEE